MPNKIQITISGTTLPIVLVKNAATDALKSFLQAGEGDIRVTLSL